MKLVLIRWGSAVETFAALVRLCEALMRTQPAFVWQPRSRRSPRYRPVVDALYVLVKHNISGGRKVKAYVYQLREVHIYKLPETTYNIF